MQITIHIPSQTMLVYQEKEVVGHYSISTSGKGPGERMNSEKTPRGWHQIRAKIGKGQAANTVFIDRRPTGEVFTPEFRQTYPNRDWILTRILWLSGLEVGKNRLGNVDTMRRFVYIHGSPDDVVMGQPGSRGCIRMRNNDIIELYDVVSSGDQVYIDAGNEE